MKDLHNHRLSILERGFTVIENAFSDTEVTAITEAISRADNNSAAFRKSAGLFAIRQFLGEIPEVAPLIFTAHLVQFMNTLFGADYFPVKAVYFDKPAASNWFVPYHQDLTISVNQKIETEGFGSWTVKGNQYAVQPPPYILENNFTVRVHLDDTDENNGALRVIPGSHLKGIYRPETIDWHTETEITCNVPRGGIMIMRPLLLHASSRTTNNKQRRVAHIEFSNQRLPGRLEWAERTMN